MRDHALLAASCMQGQEVLTSDMHDLRSEVTALTTEVGQVSRRLLCFALRSMLAQLHQGLLLMPADSWFVVHV